MTVEIETLPPPTLWTRYVLALQTHPVLTKASTSATLNALQELVASRIAGSDAQIARQKAAKMAAYGFFVSGPLGHYLYQGLDKAFKDKTGAGWSILKLLVSNLIIAPIQNAVYLAAMAYIAGAGIPGILQTLKTRLFGVMKMTWLIFPSVQIIAFKYLSQELWLPFFNLVAFVFGTYINVVTKLAAEKKKGVKGGKDL
ncbi:hypothetical protein SpCBS45565_g07745 [Spizellomyces sp. 'palustris']|nr:hypothetical protein SpCBS45565_g07745 [Spizellomyces sp. 'palustris']